MLFEIHHSIRFRYERPVFLEPMTVRLSPRQDVTQRLISHELTVSEPPAGHSLILEPDGNDARVLWFDDKREQLHLQVSSVVETLRSNPFDWILTHPQAQRLPAAYPAAEARSLAPSCSRAGTSDPGSGPVGLWAAGLAARVEHSTPDFLMQLADDIHHGFHHIGRLDGEPFSPEETLSGRTGACRDTAMLYVMACRSQGLAARFVSGYSMHHPPEVSEHELHAWAEVYLPGGGWRGYDPSLGLAVADGHVALAASPDHLMAAPTTGTYRGTDVGSQLSYVIELKVSGPGSDAGEAAA
ncbi:transglutaminase family protein [Synechococcus sp. CS-1329]|jgi:transglutaminase-like putative cysteine protease|uniref:transglutaminase family protein n=1 Tax=Synechococcus sp. CS-1329 TaxID=2847975 RepID=UPI00223AB77A|nr:transglutaminase family protein [Synechococcus sp. CS-1329]MCT0219766.1 transglutaminase family protein [Synechococcus sp. CS-1329]